MTFTETNPDGPGAPLPSRARQLATSKNGSHGGLVGDRVADVRSAEPIGVLGSTLGSLSVGGPCVVFGSFAELEALPAETPSLWQGFLPLGSLVMLWGDAKTGKSTMLAGLLGAIERGELFLGRATSQATAVWVSEEPEQTLREKAAAFQLFGLKSSIAGASRVCGVAWKSLIEQASEHALSRGHKLLIIDTFTGLADLGPEHENDAGAIATQLKPLREAASRGLAVVFVHHSNKHGRKGPRGSSAFRGLVDLSIGFHRQGQSKRFSLSTEGRSATLGGQQLQAALAESGSGWSYRAGAVESAGAQPPDPDSLLWQALLAGKSKGLTAAELVERSGLSLDQVENRLRKWREDKRPGLHRDGAGVKGDPYRWHRSSHS